MTPTRSTVAAVALVVVVATTGALWGVGAYRARLDRGAGGTVDAATAAPGAAPPVTSDSRSTSTTVASDRTPQPTRVTVAAVTTARPPPAKDAEPATSTTATGPTTALARTNTTPTRTTTTTAPPDYDGDGIPDATDRCPTRPETVNGFRDGDGCPDVVATTRAS